MDINDTSEWMERISEYVQDKEKTLTIELSDDESVFVKSNCSVFYNKEEMRYPYLRIAVAHYIERKT